MTARIPVLEEWVSDFSPLSIHKRGLMLLVGLSITGQWNWLIDLIHSFLGLLCWVVGLFFVGVEWHLDGHSKCFK